MKGDLVTIIFKKRIKTVYNTSNIRFFLFKECVLSAIFILPLYSSPFFSFSNSELLQTTVTKTCKKEPPQNQVEMTIKDQV